MKKWLVALAVLIILLAAGVIILFSSLNSIVEKAVNAEGPKLTQTAVHLDKAELSLFSGSGVFSGFTVGNPEGFGGGNAVQVGDIAVSLDTDTVFKDVVIVRNITVDSPEIVYELEKNTSNIDVLLRNIQNYANTDDGKNRSGTSEKAETRKSGKKVIIDELIIRNAKATLRVPRFKLSVRVPLPEIRLTGIGRRESGSTFARTAVIIVEEVSRTLAESTASQTRHLGSALLRGSEKAESTLMHEGEKAGDTAKNLLKDGLNLFKK